MAAEIANGEGHPVHELLTLLKGAVHAVLDFAPPLVGEEDTVHGEPLNRSCVDIIRRLLGARGATELRINALPARLLRIEHGVVDDHLEYGQDTCSICLDGYECENRVRVLRCNHVFHTGCIDNWLRRRPTCPMCQKVCC